MFGLIRKLWDSFTCKEDNDLTIITAIYPSTVTEHVEPLTKVVPIIMGKMSKTEDVISVIKNEDNKLTFSDEKKDVIDNVVPVINETKPKVKPVSHSNNRKGNRRKKK